MSFLLSQKDRQRIIDALNADLSAEIAAIIQYSHHHFTAEGLESPAIIEIFNATAKDEMEHMEKLSERIVYFGGLPTTKPGPMKTGGDLRKMIQDDLDAENGAIKQYKEHVKLCSEVGDTTTRLMLEEIQSDEEGHADTWETILAKRI